MTRTKARHCALAALMSAAVAVAGCAAESSSETARGSASLPAPSAAAASDVPRIKAPALHQGDLWIDRIHGSDHEFRIEQVHPDGTMDVSFWGTEMTTDSNLNVIVYRSLTEASSEPSTSDKPGLWFDYPLYAGKSWTNHYNWQMSGASRTKGQAEERGEAFNWEDVTVPAGTFHALKAQVVSRFFGKGGMADEATLIYWYSPQVNRFVKFDYRSNYEGAFVAELVKYQPAAANK